MTQAEEKEALEIGSVVFATWTVAESYAKRILAGEDWEDIAKELHDMVEEIIAKEELADTARREALRGASE
jgi:hypothetical protein